MTSARSLSLISLAFIALILLVSCDLLPSQTTEVVYKAGDIILQENFDDSHSGWNTWNGEDGSFVAYQGGGMRIFINKQQYDYWSIHTQVFYDVRLEVEAVNIGTVDDNSYGLICRFQDESNYYALVISSDGYAGILKVKNGNYQLLNGENMAFSEEIHTGMAVNDLRADCVGSEMTLVVNGHEVLTAADLDFISGKVGVIVGSNQQAGVDVFFDNFSVVQP